MYYRDLKTLNLLGCNLQRLQEDKKQSKDFVLHICHHNLEIDTLCISQKYEGEALEDAHL